MRMTQLSKESGGDYHALLTEEVFTTDRVVDSFEPQRISSLCC